MEDMPESRMSDCTDGPEADVAGKIMLEEHAQGGPQGKRHKHDERSVNPANVTSLVAALMSRRSAAKKPRKARALCMHERQRSRCKDCGGSGLCEHQRERSRCKDCGGSSICEHQRERSKCKDCGGSSICEHQRRKSECKDCGGSGLQRLRRQTPTCRRDQKNVPDAHTINTIVKK